METLESFGYLQVYKGYALFKKEGGKLIKSSLDETKGIITRHRGKKFIIINGHIGMREQVKTIIHEFLHLSYDPNLSISVYSQLFTNKKEYEELEDRIEKEMMQVYENQPCLVKHLRGLLLEATYREDYWLEIARLYRKEKYFNRN